MTVRIDVERCNGCGKRSEGCCEEICPGDLFYREHGKAQLREPSDCWDCFACVKACPREALCIELPFQISESRHRLSARIKDDTILWKMYDLHGSLINQCSIPNRIAPGKMREEARALAAVQDAVSKHPKPAFPCPGACTDSSLLKLSGVYAQRQKGLWMQRIKIQGGVLEAEDWQTLADLARTHTPGTPLLITTRQCIEFHNITGENLPALQHALAAAGFTGLGACGDTLRNITLCPGNGLCPGSVDFSATAAATRQVLESFEGVYNLPRKFKISFSGCGRNCAQPYINDLGFTAQVRGSDVTFTLIGAGSLGAKPETGIVLADNIKAEHIPAMALAALNVFHSHGNRTNRRKARLRHIRQELGDEAFISLFKTEYAACMEYVPSGPPVLLAASNMHPATEINVPCGLLTPNQADALAALLKATQACARILNHHRIAVFAADSAAVCTALRESLELLPLLKGPDIVACPGTTFCSQAIVNTHAAETALRAHLPAAHATPIRISGCPNGCSHATIAPIGLSGRIQRDADGTAREGFQVLIGGHLGLQPGCAQPHTAFVPTTEIAAFIQNLSAQMPGIARNGI
jgi:adenosine phosphosulfate reductase beta subunit